MKFMTEVKKIINSGQARSIIVTGNVYDLFFDGTKYVPLMDLIIAKTKTDSIPGQQKGIAQITYQVNRPIEIKTESASAELTEIWRRNHPDDQKNILDRFGESTRDSVYGLEVLRQMAELNRKTKSSNNLLIVIESADMLVPESEIRSMSPTDRRRVAVVHDWFSDPDFVNGHDSVILLAESASLIHHRISRLPQLISVAVPLPDLEQRKHFIDWFVADRKLTIDTTNVAEQSAGLSIHALRQLLCSGDVSPSNITRKVEEYMVSQLGENVVEFKRPTHKLDKVVGFTTLKRFLAQELVPGLRSTGEDCIAGCAFGGPIGGGKTFIGEALATEVDMPVIILKNIRSKWFGETDVIFERLERLLVSLYQVMVFIDEADTIFGSIQSDHDTEKRLTGKFQSLMSNPRFRGIIKWLLMSARIHLLSPDIRRPGRMDLIIPILDAEEDHDDFEAFLKWTFGEFYTSGSQFKIKSACKGYSSASFALLRSKVKQVKDLDKALAIAEDTVLPDIDEVREYQTLQAKLNCTRISLLDGIKDRREFFEKRKGWKQRVLELEALGVR